MAEWLYEKGIGEARAILVEHDAIVEAAIEIESGGLRAGAIVAARFVRALVPGRRGLAAFDGGEALVEPLPSGLSEGRPLTIEIVREAIAEPGNPKRAIARPASAGAQATLGPDLHARIAAGGLPVSEPPVHGPDRFERAGWSELIEEATSGEIGFPGGALRLSLTPAMTLFDVDGSTPPEALALAAARAVALAVERHGIAGSIGIDFPTLADKGDRRAVDSALAEALANWPHERTAMNGFGFVQLVARLERPSLLHRMAHDRTGAAARLLLRRAERVDDPGVVLLTAHPSVRGAVRAQWEAELHRRVGRLLRWQDDPALALDGGFAQAVAS